MRRFTSVNEGRVVCQDRVMWQYILSAYPWAETVRWLVNYNGLPLSDPEMMTKRTTHKLTTVKILLKREDSFAPKAKATVTKPSEN